MNPIRNASTDLVREASKKSLTGFTLVELIVVITIIFILVGSGFVYGRHALEAARGRSARTALQAIFGAEREYCIHHGDYIDLAVLVTDRYIADPNDPDQTDWNYDTPVFFPNPADPNDCGGFTARATRTAGGNAGEFIDINQTGAINMGGWSP